MSFLLFALGLAAGSFVNVIAVRYDPDKFLFGRHVIGGRSHCPHCGHKLGAPELIPLLSFLFLRARCKHCKAKISFQYPIVELISGCIFFFIPHFLSSPYILPPLSYFLSTLWILVFLTLLLVSLIDIRLRIIPDEANSILVFLGIALIVVHSLYPNSSLLDSSFIGHYALLFSLVRNVWLNRLLAAVIGALFFGALVVVTRGRGMGMGDLKLAAALGVVFGWPDLGVLTLLSFVIGSLFGVVGILLKRRKLKSHLPFGPFLALASLLVFFFGFQIVDGYFKLFGILP